MGMLFLIALAAVVVALGYYFFISKRMHQPTARDQEIRREQKRHLSLAERRSTQRTAARRERRESPLGPSRL